MADHLYNHQKPLYKNSSSSRSTIDAYLPEHPSLLRSSRYFPSHSLSSDPPSSSSLYKIPSSFAVDTTRFSSASDTPLTGGSARLSSVVVPPATSTWPSFEVSSGISKRTSQALYDHHSNISAHMIGKNEAWFTSDTLSKRPRFESASILPTYPQRPGEKDCTHYMLTRTCKFGDNCKFDHPIWVPAGGIPDWKEAPSVPSESHPERPGEPDCPYFVKTQKCKFGVNCKFNHPKDKLDTSSKVEASDLPERPSEPLCSFYMKTGNCKFGAACKFHHPKDMQASSVGQEAENGAQTHSTDHLATTGDGKAVNMLTSNPASSYNSKGLPMHPDEVDCPFYMKTGSCKYGANCRYNHPDRNDLFSPLSVINPNAAVLGHAVLPSLANFNVGLYNPAASISLQPGLAQTMVSVIYPQRPGQMECDYYMKSGECKFGERCRFHHPIDRSVPSRQQAVEQNVKLTLAGLPRREGVQHCPFYMKTGTCSYGATCKFDHPPPGEVLALTEKETSANAEEEGKENGGTTATAEE